MTEEDIGNGLIPDPMLVNSQSGQLTHSAQRAKEDKVSKERENEWTLLDEALTTSNTLYDIVTSTAIKMGSTPEDGFDAKKLPGLFDNVPPMFHKELAATKSTNEAWSRRARIEEYMKNSDKLAASGYTGMAASLAAGIVDADILLIPFTEGVSLAAKTGVVLGKIGMKPGRVSGAIRGAAAGLEAGAVVSGTGAAFGQMSQVSDIPHSLLMGMGMGATIGTVISKGAISPYEQMQTAQRAAAEYQAAKENNFTPPGMTQGGKSAGAAQARQVPTPVNLRDSSKEWFNRAADDINAVNARQVLEGKMNAETTNTDSFIGKNAEKVQNWVDKSPMKSLYTSVSDMGVIGNKLAYDLLYHPGGMMDGASHPAAGLDAMYTQELSMPIQNYHSLAMDYMGRPKDTVRNKLSNAFVRKEQYREFDQAVRYELETRYHDGKGQDDVHPSVKEMADHIDAMTSKAVDIQKGRAGEQSVRGAEDLQHKSGYYNRRWSGEAIKKFDEKVVIAALKDAYTRILPPGANVDPDILDSVVQSIVTRAKALDEGIDTNLVGLLRSEGKEFLRDTLKNNKIKDDQIEKLIAAFVGDAAERAKPGFLKGRIELDMRTPISGTNATLLDLLEPDMYKSLHYYSRKVAGTSAMARKGYQLGDKTSLIESIKDELQANGKNVNDPRIDDILETAFSYFGAGSIGKGVDPLLLSTMRLTRQSLLGSLGLTQMSELGNILTMVGVEAAVKVMPKEMKALLSGKKTPLVQELHDAFIFMDKDHVLHDDELALDTVGQSSIVQTQFMENAHKVIGFGDKIAGYTSLFYTAMTYSQRIALSGINHKLYKLLGSGTLDAATSRRLLDVGLDETMTAKLQDYINKGIVKKVDGELTMQFDKWKPEDLQEYKQAMHLFVSRAVQKNLPGEIPYWATKQFGQFVTQLRMFPIMAAQKQFLRNMRHADSTTAAAMLWNLGVAGIIYSVSETIKGRGDQLNSKKIAKGAINYAPTTGWMPMITDPMAEIMGMPELRMNKYGPPGRATDGIIPVPPAIPTLNRMLHLPGAALGSLNGVDRSEAASLSSIPIIGNTYGFSAMFNHLKEE